MLSGKCICYSRLLNPYAQCQFVPPSPQPARRLNSRQLSESPVTITKTSVTCNCPFDAVNGYFKPITEQHQFGQINPPVCLQCIVDGLGPKPLTNPAGSYTKPCTVFGGPDPNFANITLAWRTCSNRGFWDGTACVCNTGWTLGEPLESFNSSVVIRTCDICAPNWGPLVAPNAVGAPFCSVVMTPDANGVPQICGGHGVFQSGKCNCNYGFNLTPFENVNTCL